MGDGGGDGQPAPSGGASMGCLVGWAVASIAAIGDGWAAVAEWGKVDLLEDEVVATNK